MVMGFREKKGNEPQKPEPQTKDVASNEQWLESRGVKLSFSLSNLDLTSTRFHGGLRINTSSAHQAPRKLFDFQKETRRDMGHRP